MLWIEAQGAVQGHPLGPVLGWGEQNLLGRWQELPQRACGDIHKAGGAGAGGGGTWQVGAQATRGILVPPARFCFLNARTSCGLGACLFPPESAAGRAWRRRRAPTCW